jgi:hypothetical protein
MAMTTSNSTSVKPFGWIRGTDTRRDRQYDNIANLALKKWDEDVVITTYLLQKSLSIGKMRDSWFLSPRLLPKHDSFGNAVQRPGSASVPKMGNGRDLSMHVAPA